MGQICILSEPRVFSYLLYILPLIGPRFIFLPVFLSFFSGAENANIGQNKLHSVTRTRGEHAS